MNSSSKISDRGADTPLAGGIAQSAEHAELAAFLDETKTLFLGAPAEKTAAAHLAAILEAAREVATAPHHATAAVPASGRARTRFAFRGRMAAAAACLTLVAAFTGAAYAGALPGPVQKKVADIAKNVGLSLPRADKGPKPTDVGTTGRRTQQDHGRSTGGSGKGTGTISQGDPQEHGSGDDRGGSGDADAPKDRDDGAASNSGGSRSSGDGESAGLPETKEGEGGDSTTSNPSGGQERSDRRTRTDDGGDDADGAVDAGDADADSNSAD